MQVAAEVEVSSVRQWTSGGIMDNLCDLVETAYKLCLQQRKAVQNMINCFTNSQLHARKSLVGSDRRKEERNSMIQH